MRFTWERNSLSTPDAARLAAYRALVDVLARGRTLDRALDQATKALPPRDRAFGREVATGVVRHYFSLSHALAPLLRQSVADLDTPVLVLLLIGAYQIRHMRVPSFAAVNETVDLARQTPASRAGGLVNAVLRRFAHARDEATPTVDAEARYDHPLWMIELLSREYPGDWEQLLTTDQERAPLVVRIDRRRITRDAYLEQLAGLGIAARPASYSPIGVQFAEARDAASIPGFAEGVVAIQDEGAQLVAEEVEFEARARVLDACAAPGNKTAQLLEREPSLDLLACDSDPQRVAFTKDALARAGHRARVVCADLRRLRDWWDGNPFDHVLLDAPCTGTGTLRRHPDIKLTRLPEDVDRLAALQRELIECAWEVLAPGGQLVYATCSLLAEENEQVAQHLLRNAADAERRAPRQAAFGSGQLLTTSDGPDGFFVARFRKRS